MPHKFIQYIQWFIMLCQIFAAPATFVVQTTAAWYLRGAWPADNLKRGLIDDLANV
jgi:hypothetical protein